MRFAQCLALLSLVVAVTASVEGNTTVEGTPVLNGVDVVAYWDLANKSQGIQLFIWILSMLVRLLRSAAMFI